MTIPATPMGPEHTEEVSHEYFPTCTCDGAATVNMSVPPAYDLFKEREAVTNLFLNIHGMLDYIRNMEDRLSEDSSDRDSNIRQLPAIRVGDGSTD